MSWLADFSAWVSGVTVPQVTDFQNITHDIHTWGQNVDGGANALVNTNSVTLNGGGFPGVTFSTTAGSWVSGVATLTLGTHTVVAGQIVGISSVTPAGFNIAQVVVSSVTSTTISYPLGSNPGTYTGSGTVKIAAFSPTLGCLAADVSGNLWVFNGTTWIQQTTTSPNVSSAVGLLSIPHGGTGLTSLPVSAGIIGTNSSQQLVSSSLTGDVTSTGAATTVVKVNGASLPVSGATLATNSSGQIVLGKTPVIVSETTLTAQTANASGTVFTPGSGSQGWYRITVAVALTTAATSTSTIPSTTLAAHNADNLALMSFPLGNGSNPSINAGQAQYVASTTFFAEASTAITYSQSGYATAGATSMAFSLRMLVEYLGT